MNGREKVPVKMWEKELKNLTTERIDLAEKFYDLKDDIKSVESLRRNAENLMREAQPERHIQQKHRAIDLDR